MLFALTERRVKGAQSTLFVRRRRSRQGLHEWNCSLNNLRKILCLSIQSETDPAATHS